MKVFCAIALCLMLTLSACKETDIQTVSKALSTGKKVSEAIALNIAQAEHDSLITHEDAAPVLAQLARITDKITLALDVVNKIAALDPQSRKDVVAVLVPIGEALNEIDFNGIKDEKVRKQVQTAVFGFQSALTTTKLLVSE